MTLELTEQEAQALVALINLAVKASGMQVAEAAVILTRKIEDAAKPQQVEQVQKTVRAKKEKKEEKAE